ncbi:hypothetical protein ACU4GA_26900 [Methylobacterium oryzae CBMB20]
MLLVGRAAVRRHWHLIAATGLLWSSLGLLVVIDSLDGALHVPDRWFGLILLAEGVSSSSSARPRSAPRAAYASPRARCCRSWPC